MMTTPTSNLERNHIMTTSSVTRSCGLAVWSLILGILAVVLCFVGPVFGIPAAFCGHKALGRIKGAAGELTGKGPAIAGLVLGYMSIAMFAVIGLLSILAIPNFIHARDTAWMNVCINNLRILDAAKQQWALENGKENSDTPTLDDLKPYLGSNWTMRTCPKGGVYVLHTVQEPPTCSIPGHELPR
jgi:competence protein ComGC